MQKVYRALVWLAGGTLVLGVYFAVVMFTPLAENVVPPQGVTVSGPSVSVFVSVFAQSLLLQLLASYSNVFQLLVGGVTVLAIALAWADRRRAWLIALLVVTFLTLLWPDGVAAWFASGFYHPQLPLKAPTGPWPITSPEGLSNFTILVVPLIPVVMALILALTGSKPDSATPAGTLDGARSPV
jgi:hypothetical protein